MATKNHIIKHRAFFKTLTAAYHPFILDGFFIKYRDSSALCPVRVIKNRRQLKHTIFTYFLLNLVNFIPINLKIDTHIN